MYNLGIYILDFFLKTLALFNTKIKLGVIGRRNTFLILNKNLSPNDKTIWFHCASLGEYEQGLPVFEAVRNNYRSHKIILTFFSPSGYEIRKCTPIADIVTYLPLDTKKNAHQFLSVVNPEFTVFVKYDVWPNFLNTLKKKKLRAILISASFRKEQSYFKWYGNNVRNALKAFEHIFVQNEHSKSLLHEIGITNVSVSGDTRFDRVSNQLQQDNNLDFISKFKSNSICIVIGSSWPEDEAILLPYINKKVSKKIKFIIAPHEIKKNHIKEIISKLTIAPVLFSEKAQKNLSEHSVLIIDTIGLLSKIYSYADISYVGGAMGTTGLHNILEPSVFGVPIIIGKNHQKFPEASQMINHGGVISIRNEAQLESQLDDLVNSLEKRQKLGKLNSDFIENSKGAVVQIMDYIRI
ncbi:glycosyltransferase N-terminal domain-containing protein [uncultured Psychroserpens sp.]|uniref:3-deoxy-D-manno-octulosonic acid transferase n=1 Tax=uncultured Psychroserpens sp. TaxID=255436 RepID=UPI00262FBEBB|nr:glycosyltransferase N-terminal domain-containing protein [uncultured Psychroserpens sp.]